MKNILLTAAICLLSIYRVQAQPNPQVIRTEPQTSDLFNVLEPMDVCIYHFDLKEFLNEKYKFTAYIDEYSPNKEPKRIYNNNLGNNIKSLSEIPEEHQKEFRKIKQIPEGKNEWENIKEISIYLRKQNDSVAAFTINIPEVLIANKRVPLQQLKTENFSTYFYRPRPFKFNATEIKESLEIPLVLYASAWVDEKYKIIRFCGEKEIDPEMNAKILKHVPHYYIIGIKAEK